jgi:hypothetical protein
MFAISKFFECCWLKDELEAGLKRRFVEQAQQRWLAGTQSTRKAD